MTLLYYDPRFLKHETGAHPERAERLREVMSHLAEVGLLERCRLPAWETASQERIGRVHPTDYVRDIERLAQRGGGWIDADTVVSPQSPEAALLAAGAACDAVDRVLNGEDTSALCLVRPPGHHALPKQAMGFCLLNSIAIAALVAKREHDLDRILIVDWDVHHGNGTQDIFYGDGAVGFFSVHRWPFYPGTGAFDETGSGDGLGATLNLPLEFGTSRTTYRQLFRRELENFASRLKPQLVLISAGFDSHRTDPVGSLGLETEDFGLLTQDVLDIARVHAGGRVVSILEGGYNPEMLARCVELHLRTLMGHAPE